MLAGGAHASVTDVMDVNPFAMIAAMVLPEALHVFVVGVEPAGTPGKPGGRPVGRRIRPKT